jgi:hypothetical protein
MKTTPKWMAALAVVSAILFGITLTLSLLAFNFERQLFNPDVYKQALSEQNVCGRLPLVISQQIISSAQSKDKGNLLGLVVGSVEPDTLQGIIKTVLPCQMIENVVNGGIDQIFSQINYSTGEQQFSLTQVKKSIEQNSATAVDEFLMSQPDCSAAQLLQLGTNALLGQNDKSISLLCNPPAALREAFTIPMGVMVNSALQGLPDQIPMPAGLARTMNSLRIIRTAMSWSLLLPLLFLGLTTAFAVRSWRGLLLWWGTPLLVSGLAALVISLVLRPMVFELMGVFILPNLPVNLVPEAVKLISDVFSSVALGLVKPIQAQSAMLSLIGLGMIVGERISRPKSG